MAQRFTMIGTEVFEWDKLMDCSSSARYLWFAIYASGDAKNSVPAMLRATVRSLAEAAHIQPDEALASMDELVKAGLLEYDQALRIIRLTALPNAVDAPSSFKVVKGWWTRFHAFPVCPMRDSHVAVLHSLAEQASEKAKEEIRRVWDETFGTIVVPVKRHRGRRMFDSDTSTEAQPSLFGSAPALDAVTDRQTSATSPPGYPIDGVSIPPVSVSVWGIGSVSSGSGAAVEQISGSAGRLRLGTVPLTGLPFSVADLLHAIAADSAGRFAPAPCDERLVDALCATIRACEAEQVGVDDLRVVGQWMAAGGLAFRSDLGPGWAAKPGHVLDAVAQSRVWAGQGKAPVGHPTGGPRRDSRRAEPAPASAFGSGRRRI